MESKPATAVTSAQLADVFNSAFSDYIGGEVDFTAESLERWISKNYISLPRSHVLFSSRDIMTPVAFGFVAIREDKPGDARIPIMGVVPSARGRGAGSRLLTGILEAENSNGMRTIELECIQDHTIALGLYKRKGFTILRELPGWERDAPAAGEFDANPELQPCAIEEVASLVKGNSAENLTWQPWGFYKRSEPSWRAFKLGHAYCVVDDPSDPGTDTIHLHSLIVEPGKRGCGNATKLVRAMLGGFPDKRWEASPIFPKEYCYGIAKELGFAESSDRQYQMRLRLQ